jgi:rhodanese-related sulfurtransferase
MFQIQTAAKALDASKQYVVYCLGGFRSTITTSIMRQQGLNAVDIVGGYERGVLAVARCHTTAQGVCTKSK